MVSPLSQAQLSMFLASQGLDAAYVDMIFEMLKTLNYFE